MYDIITIGTASRDVFLSSPLFKTLYDGKRLKKIGLATGRAQCLGLGAKIEIDEINFSTGGGAANAAVTFSRQGLKTAALIRMGEDDTGCSIIVELLKEKVSPLSILDKTQITAYSVILLTPRGERTILVHRGASDDLRVKEIPFNKLKTRWAYVSPGKISYAVIEKLFKYLSENKTLIAFNPSGYFLQMGIKKLKPLLSRAKVVILNREEAAFLTGIDYHKEREIFNKLDKEVDGIAIMTDGNKGVMVSDGENIYSAGTFGGKSIDRTGAGDAFGSGFVAGLIRKIGNWKLPARRSEPGAGGEIGNLPPKAIEYAIRLGSANATSVIKHIGAKKGILTKRQFEQVRRWRHLPIEIKRI